MCAVPQRAEGEDRAEGRSFPRGIMAGLGAVAIVLVTALYWDTFSWWWKAWRDEGYYCTHGPLVPLVVGYLIWSRVSQAGDLRHETGRRGVFTGWVIVAMALCLQLLSLRMGVWFTSGVSFVALCFGSTWALWGRDWARLLAGPISFLVFMIPVPFVAAILTGPLQLRSASFAAMAAGTLGIPVTREGLALHLPNYSLQVAPSCSGVNSLFSLVPLATLSAYLQSGEWWQKVALVTVAIPIALLANGIRLVLTLVLASNFGPALAEGYFHSASGLVLFGLALLGLFAVSRLIVRPTVNGDIQATVS